MTTTFQANQSLGEIVAAFAGAGAVFKSYSIDFCCGGHRSLAEAAQQKRLEPEAVIHQLEQAYEEFCQRTGKAEDWREAKLTALADHIEMVHHAYLKKELPLLSEYVTRVYRVHGMGHGDSLKPLHRLFHTMKTELEQHLVDEEAILFPLIRKYEETNDPTVLAEAREQLAKLEQDHSGVGDILKEMREVTEQYTLPEGACATYSLMFRKLVELEDDMFRHIHLENNILFRRIQ